MIARLPRARSAWAVWGGARLAYVVRVGERSASRGHAGRVKKGRAVHRCRRSACLSPGRVCPARCPRAGALHLPLLYDSTTLS